MDLLEQWEKKRLEEAQTMSYDFQMTWEKFWDAEKGNPASYFHFLLGSGRYQIRHGDSCWFLEVYSGNSGLGAGERLKVKEKGSGRRDYRHEDDWNDLIDAYYRLLTTPCHDENFKGRSFKDAMEDIFLEG